MMRAVFGEVLLFLLPFAAFALYLLLLRRSPLKWLAWSRHVSWLTIAGLCCVVLALLFTGLTADRQKGAYQPSHLENGRLVPGRFR